MTINANSALFGYFIGAILAAVISWFACWLTNRQGTKVKS